MWSVGDYLNIAAFSKYEIVTLPEGCEYIGDYAFGGCTKLVEVNFPSTLKTIYDDSFYQCPAAEDMELPKNVEIRK